MPRRWPGREAADAGVAAQLAAGLVLDRARRRRRAVPVEERAVVAAAEEADLLALPRARRGEAEARRARSRTSASCGRRAGSRAAPARRSDAGRACSSGPSRRRRGRRAARRRARRCARSGRCARAPRPAAPAASTSSSQPEVAVAGRARVRRLPRLVAGDEAGHDGVAEGVTKVERQVRKPALVAEIARPAHAARRAAGAVGVGRVRVDPELQRDAERLGRRLGERDGRVDAARTSPRPPGRRRARSRRARRRRRARRGRRRRRPRRSARRAPATPQAACAAAAPSRAASSRLAPLRLGRQPGGRGRRRRARVGSEPHRHQLPAIERDREPDAVVAGAAARAPSPSGPLDRSGAREVDHATLSTAR